MYLKTFVVTEFQTNCYLVSNKLKETLIIDPGGEPEKIINYITSENLNPKYLVNTHIHSDHIGADQRLVNEYNIPLLVHENTQRMLKDNTMNMSNFTGIDFTPPDNIEYLKEGDKIKLGELSFMVLYTPGHTEGSMSLLGTDILFTGDLIFRESVGRTDLPTGDFSQLEETIQKKIFTLDEEITIYPGHGPETTVGFEKRNNKFIKPGRSI